jgi:hypothetical protein
VEDCIEHDPQKRPSAKELLQHPFFTQFQPAAMPSLGGFPEKLNSTSSIYTQDVESQQSLQHFDFNVEKSQIETGPKTTASCELQVVGRVGQSTEIKLKMTYQTGTNISEIKFPFNLKLDTATDVVFEMVKENLIFPNDEQLVRRKIEELIRSVLINRLSEKNEEGFMNQRVSDYENTLQTPNSALVQLEKTVDLASDHKMQSVDLQPKEGYNVESSGTHDVQNSSDPRSVYDSAGTSTSSSFDSANSISNTIDPAQSDELKKRKVDQSALTNVTGMTLDQLTRAHSQNTERNQIMNFDISKQNQNPCSPSQKFGVESPDEKNAALALKLTQLQELNLESFNISQKYLLKQDSHKHLPVANDVMARSDTHSTHYPKTRPDISEFLPMNEIRKQDGFSDLI